MSKAIKAAGKRVAGSPPKASIRVTKTLSLDHEVYEQVKRKCGEEGLTISGLMDALLAAWLEEVAK